MTKKTPHDSDVNFIQALAELLRENDLTELQVKRDYGENDSLNVRVSRQQPAQQVVSQIAAAPAAVTPTAMTAPAAKIPPTCLGPSRRPWSAQSTWRQNQMRPPS